MSKKKPVVTSREDYVVDGGAIVRTDHGDMVHVDFGADGERAASITVPRGEAEFYPIGARVRVTVERLK
jgi:hypothetical protein